MGVAKRIEQLAQSPRRYLLYTRFSMPTSDGSVDAVSVSTTASKILQSIYVLMLSMIVLEIWALLVLVIMSFVVRRLRITHNMGVANVVIWNAQSSPMTVAIAMRDYWTRIPLYSAAWTLLALLLWIASILVSSLVAPHLIIGQAGPVNPDFVYIPEFPSEGDRRGVILTNALLAPSDHRAVDNLRVGPSTTDADSATKDVVKFESQLISSETDDSPIYRFDYSYNISGVDFGLQHAPDLLYIAQGSCYTDYGWYLNTSTESSDISGDIFADYYLPPSANDNETIKVSIEDGKQPMVITYRLPHSEDPQIRNKSFAFVVSSIQRLSYTSSVDPWYRTEPLPVPEGSEEAFRVSSARPVLSCWQEELCSFRGKTTSIPLVNELDGLAPALATIMQHSLDPPRILQLTGSLGPSALKSAITSSVGWFFDADTSSVETDLGRLVFGSYIATKNIFYETTQFDYEQFPDIKNDLVNRTTMEPLPGIGDFIILTPDAEVLSIRVLVVVPTVLVVLLLLVFMLGENRFKDWPWSYVHAMKASVLYSIIDTKHFKGVSGEAGWMRSMSPYSHNDEQAHVRPDFNRSSRSYIWNVLPSHAYSESVAMETKGPATVEERLLDSPGSETV